MDDYDAKIEKAKGDIADAKKQMERAQKQRGNGDGQRDILQAEQAKLIKEKAALEAEFKNYERSDPKIVEKMQNDSKIAKDAVNRWTDNLYLIQQWIQQKMPGFSEKDLEKNFPIFKELDYVE